MHCKCRRKHLDITKYICGVKTWAAHQIILSIYVGWPLSVHFEQGLAFYCIWHSCEFNTDATKKEHSTHYSISLNITKITFPPK